MKNKCVFLENKVPFFIMYWQTVSVCVYFCAHRSASAVVNVRLCKSTDGRNCYGFCILLALRCTCGRAYVVWKAKVQTIYLLDIWGGGMWLWIIGVRLLSRWFHKCRGPSFWRLPNCTSTSMSFTSSCRALSQLHSNVVLWCRLWRMQSILVWR